VSCARVPWRVGFEVVPETVFGKPELVFAHLEARFAGPYTPAHSQHHSLALSRQVGAAPKVSRA